MQRDDLRALCLACHGAVEDFPFGDDVAVYKVCGKIFALLPVNPAPLTISLKCDPLEAELLREKYPAITAGYHLNKRHWNTIHLDGSLPPEEVSAMIADSYALVVRALPRKDRDALHAQSAAARLTF
ncbi:MAG: MmcQ/YjbR family DNA-binding protein [Anaerolineae bacterium]|nr:MmcQ/YjbR family DNA-binding protein [Anaerolineae bacterium]